MRYANLVIKICLFAYIFIKNRLKPKQLVIKKPNRKKPIPLFSQLKPTEIELANQNRTGLVIVLNFLIIRPPHYCLHIFQSLIPSTKILNYFVSQSNLVITVVLH